MKRIVCIGVLAACVFALSPMLFADDNAKSHYDVAKYYYPMTPGTRGTMITEGFEGNFPPTGWDTVSTPGGSQGGSTLIPWHKDANYFYTGSFGAAYGWGYNLDGWMRILNLDFSAVATSTISWWWESSYYWHVNPYDHGDLFIEVSTDGGSSWDVLWTFGDSAMVVNSGVPWPWENWVWYQSTLSLDAYAGEANVWVGFHVVADDNADIGVDDVLIDTVETGIQEEEDELGRNAFGFASVMPNPVTNNAIITYTIPQTGHVTLDMYNSTGRHIASLVHGTQQPGTHSVHWDACNVPNGVYLLKLHANDEFATHKLILLK